MARVFNAVAAMGICASLAMLGWEVHTERPSEVRYNFSLVVPPPDADDDDDMDAPPSANDRQDGNHNWRPGDPRDGDEPGHPIVQPDPAAPIPI
ncbi:MAG TPA: hypothetical protein VMD53_07415 [Rhizomicrobium sp.]|nr:hypothetical protein [Rhizomicrobium sp.]